MPIQQMMLGGGGAVATKTYVDDIFSTYVYTGNNTAGRVVNNGIDFSGEGGLTWIKRRGAGAGDHILNDTVRGAGEYYKVMTALLIQLILIVLLPLLVLDLQ